MTEVVSLGLWIVSRNAEVWGREGLEYRGLDRRPDLPGPDQDVDLRDQGRQPLLEIRNEFWRLEESRDLHRNPEASLRLCAALNAHGFSVEVVLAELVSASDLSDVPTDLRSSYEYGLRQWVVESPPPVHAIPLGMDVTYPLPTFHSAIRQPTLRDMDPDLIKELNDFGLFEDLDVAQDVARRGNQRDTSWRPLCPVRIHSVDAAQFG